MQARRAAGAQDDLMAVQVQVDLHARPLGEFIGGQDSYDQADVLVGLALALEALDTDMQYAYIVDALAAAPNGDKGAVVLMLQKLLTLLIDPETEVPYDERR